MVRSLLRRWLCAGWVDGWLDCYGQGWVDRLAILLWWRYCYKSTNSVPWICQLQLNLEVWHFQWAHYEVDNDVAASIPHAFHFRNESDIDGGLDVCLLQVTPSQSKMEAYRLSRWEWIFLPEGHRMTRLLSTMKDRRCATSPVRGRKDWPKLLSIHHDHRLLLCYGQGGGQHCCFLCWKWPCLQVWTFAWRLYEFFTDGRRSIYQALCNIRLKIKWGWLDNQLLPRSSHRDKSSISANIYEDS